jgi:hypothetical protein
MTCSLFEVPWIKRNANCGTRRDPTADRQGLEEGISPCLKAKLVRLGNGIC